MAQVPIMGGGDRSRMKRTITAVVLGVVIAGGAGVAWAQTGDRAARREAAKTCLQEARAAHPDADGAAIREAVKACLADAGFLPRITDEQKDQAKACLQEAKEANPDAGRRAVRQAARPCLEAAGILPPLSAEQQERRAKLRSCVESARAAHPDDRAAARDAVKECMAS
jgi:hypothetical protein